MLFYCARRTARKSPPWVIKATAANPATYMVYPLRDFVEVGGLISYGSDIVDALRQAGQYVGRIIKGAKPAELPIVKADKFELVINAQTARMLGLTVPSSLLNRADEIID